jgi:uncharacterized protein (DUF4415 family)
MNKQASKSSATDWNKVRAQALQPVAYDPETDPYDPNDEAAVKAFWGDAQITRGPGRPRAEVTRPMLSMRIDPDVLQHLRESGKGWQTRVNALLREAVNAGRL